MARVSRVQIAERPPEWEDMSPAQRRAYVLQQDALAAREARRRAVLGLPAARPEPMPILRAGQDDPDAPPPRSELAPGAPTGVAAVAASASSRSRRKDAPLDHPVYLTPESRKRLREIALYNPDASNALFLARRLALAGLEWEVVERDDDGGAGVDESEEGAAYVHDLDRRVAQSYGGGGLESLANMALGYVLEQGAVAVDLDVADSLDDVLDIGLPEPGDIGFRRFVVPGAAERTKVLPIWAGEGAGNAKDAQPLNPHQFRYVGIDCAGSSPYGTPVFLPVLDTAWPQNELRDSLHKLLRSHAFSKPDITVIGDRVLAAYRDRPAEEQAAILEQAIEDVSRLVEDAAADDSFIHSDAITTAVMSAQHANGSWSPDEWTRYTDQDHIGALKTLPAMMGRSWGNALSSQGDTQWKVYVAGIESVRDVALGAIEWAVNQALRIRGIRAVFRFKPATIEASDRVAEAQADLTERQAALVDLVDLGIVTREELRQRFYGSPLPDEIAETAPAPAAPQRAAALPVVLPDPVRIAPDAAWHEPDCVCGGCSARGASGPELATREPYVPEDGEHLNQLQMGALADVDEDDLSDAARDWRALVRSLGLGVFAGILDARSLEDDERTARAVRQGDAPAGWTFDVRLQRFRYPGRDGRLGRLLAPERQRRLVERVMRAQQAEVRQATSRLVAGRLTPRAWQEHVATRLKTTHLQVGALATGGRERMGFSELGRVGQLVRTDYAALGRFGEDIAAGRMSEAQILARADLYSEANVRRGYAEAQRASHAAAGYGQERRILASGAAHCEGCAEEASRGYVTLGTLSPIGAHECGSRDRCAFEYRYSDDEAAPPRRAALDLGAYAWTS